MTTRKRERDRGTDAADPEADPERGQQRDARHRDAEIGARDAGIDSAVRPERSQLRDDLAKALDVGPLEARYRPVVRTADGSTEGLEMVLGRSGRPGPFTGDGLALSAARAGMATRVDALSLELASLDVRQGALPPDVDWIAVGLSSRGLRTPRIVGRTLRLSGELERLGRDLVVVLSAKDPDMDVAEAALGLSRLRTSGVQAALDHLAQGRFPFSRLAEYPLDFVKMRGKSPLGEAPISERVGYLRALVRVVRAAGPRVVLVLEPSGTESPHDHVLEEADYAVGGRFGPAVPLPHLR